MKKTIIHISSKLFHPCFDDLIKQQDKRHNLHFVHMDLGCEKINYRFVTTRDKRVPCYVIRPRKEINFAYDPRLRDSFDTLYGRIRPHAIHIQLFSGMNIIPILNVASSMGLLKIMTLHDHSLFCCRGTCYDGSKNCSVKALSDCACAENQWFAKNNHTSLANLNAWRLEQIKHIVTMCDAIICPSENQRKTLLRILGEKESDSIITLHYGVETPKTGPLENKNPIPTFGYLGTIDPLKGLPIIEEALRRVNARRLRHKILLGVRTINSRPVERTSLERLRRYRQVEIIENIAHKDLTRRFFSHIDYLIIPSLWEETGPMTLLEALSHKIPALVADRASMREKIKADRNSRTFTEAPELADLMKKIIAGKIKKYLQYGAITKNTEEYAKEIESVYECASRRPSRVLVLKTGYLCNNRCIFCVTGNNTPRMFVPAQTLESYLVRSRRKFDMLTFTGGEPTIRQDFLSLLEKAYRLGYRTTLQTNGRIFCDKELCRKLTRYHLTVVTHLEGYKASIHERITTIPGSFLETVTGIKNLIAAGTRVTAKFILTRQNQRHVLSTAKFLSRLGVKKLWLTFLTPAGYADIYLRQVVPRYSDVSKIVAKTLSWVEKESGMSLVIEGFPFCRLPACFHEYAIEYRGDDKKRRLCVYPSDRGKQDDRAFSLERRSEDKKKPSVCSDCALINRCEGIYKKYIDAYGSDEFHPVSRRAASYEPAKNR